MMDKTIIITSDKSLVKCKENRLKCHKQQETHNHQ